MSFKGAHSGVEKENMTYLAAVTTLRGEPPHNKNNQMSFVHNPRFHSTYTTLGWMEERRGEETRSWMRCRMGGEQAGADAEKNWSDIL